MSKSKSDLIPPSPDERDYAQTADANAAEIFDREDPFALFADWLEDAKRKEPNDANAMALATADADGLPDVRMVLLKDVDADGFVFYTNLESAKGRQIAATPKAALGFHWKSLRRQVRIRGDVSRVTDAEADEYFATRAAQSRISAIASDQSRPLTDRAMFEQRVAELSEIYGDGPDIPRPEFWGGFRLVPVEIEFWQDQAFRMHDRVKYVREAGGWTSGRLYP